MGNGDSFSWNRGLKFKEYKRKSTNYFEIKENPKNRQSRPVGFAQYLETELGKNRSQVSQNNTRCDEGDSKKSNSEKCQYLEFFWYIFSRI